MWSRFLRLKNAHLSKSDRLFILNVLMQHGTQTQSVTIKQLPKEVKLSSATVLKSIQFLSQIGVLDLNPFSPVGPISQDTKFSFSSSFIQSISSLTAPDPLFETAIRKLLFTERKPSIEDYFLATLLAHCNRSFRVVKQDFNSHAIPLEISINDLISLTGLKKQTIYCYLNKLKGKKKIEVTGIGLRSNSVCLFDSNGIHIKVLSGNISVFANGSKKECFHRVELYYNPIYKAENSLINRCLHKYLSCLDTRPVDNYVYEFDIFVSKNNALVRNAFRKATNHDFNREKIHLVLEGIVCHFLNLPEEHQEKIIEINGESQFYSIGKEQVKNLINSEEFGFSSFLQSQSSYLSSLRIKNHDKMDRRFPWFVKMMAGLANHFNEKNLGKEEYDRHIDNLESISLFLAEKDILGESKEQPGKDGNSFHHDLFYDIDLLVFVFLNEIIIFIQNHYFKNQCATKPFLTDLLKKLRSIKALDFRYFVNNDKAGDEYELCSFYLFF